MIERIMYIVIKAAFSDPNDRYRTMLELSQWRDRVTNVNKGNSYLRILGLRLLLLPLKPFLVPIHQLLDWAAHDVFEWQMVEAIMHGTISDFPPLIRAFRNDPRLNNVLNN